MPGTDLKKLSVIIPVFNEERSILQILDKIKTLDIPLHLELLIVNDGSSDKSPALIAKWRAANPDSGKLSSKYFEKPNGGKGSAVKLGIQQSSGDVVIIQDADLEYDPGDFMKCVSPILNGEADVVYGSRELQTEGRKFSHISFFMGGLLLSNWINLLFGSELTDEPTCYKTFKGSLIRAILFEGDHFEWEPEITAKLLRLGYNIKEVAVSYHPRKLSEGKKINWRDGVQGLWISLLWRFKSVKKERHILLASEENFRHIFSRKRRELSLFFALIVLCLAARLFIAMPGLSGGNDTHFFRPDSYSYVMPALALAKNGQYNESPDSITPATLRPPGYPAFLSAIFFCNGGGFKLPVILFCILGTLTCAAVFFCGKLWGGFKTGLIAALLFGFNITSIAVTPLFLSDTLFCFFTVLQLYFFSRFYFAPKIMHASFGTLFAALAVLIRPVGLLWILPCVVLILAHKNLKLKHRLAGALFSLIIFGTIISPWLFRNYMLGAGFTIDTNSGNMLYHNGAILRGVLEKRSPEEIRQEMYRETETEFKAYPEKYSTESNREAYKISRLKKLVADAPFTYAALHFRPLILIPDAASFYENLGLSNSGKGTFDVMNQKGVIAAVKYYFDGRLWLIIFLIPLIIIVAVSYLGASFELIRWLWNRKVYLFFFFLAFTEYYLILPGPVTMPRYQLPALPLICIMAALFLSRLCFNRKSTDSFLDFK